MNYKKVAQHFQTIDVEKGQSFLLMKTLYPQAQLSFHGLDLFSRSHATLVGQGVCKYF